MNRNYPKDLRDLITFSNVLEGKDYLFNDPAATTEARINFAESIAEHYELGTMDVIDDATKLFSWMLETGEDIDGRQTIGQYNIALVNVRNDIPEDDQEEYLNFIARYFDINYFDTYAAFWGRSEDAIVHKWHVHIDCV